MSHRRSRSRHNIRTLPRPHQVRDGRARIHAASEVTSAEVAATHAATEVAAAHAATEVAAALPPPK